MSPVRTAPIEAPELTTQLASVPEAPALGSRITIEPLNQPPRVAVLGLGYVGLPTSLALSDTGFPVSGVDVSDRRIDDIRARRVDLLPSDLDRLSTALASPNFVLSTDATRLADADIVLICVPTPVDETKLPDLKFVKAACNAALAYAHCGQTIILTSTSYVGTTRDLLVTPLGDMGFAVGTDIHVAFSPERIDPGNTRHEQGSVPRVVGGVTPACADHAADLIADIAADVRVVSSPEAAELTKLVENSFRAVNIALANEVADISGHLGLDPIEVIDAAATKPYGFMPFYPGAGVGGHCIPCDPYYLVAPLREKLAAPLIEQAMAAIAARPGKVVDRAVGALAALGKELAGSRVLVEGVSYKPGIRDVRESPAIEIVEDLVNRGANVAYHDPLVPALDINVELGLLSVHEPKSHDCDLVILVTRHPGADYGWLDGVELLLDCTYRSDAGQNRIVV